MKKQHNIVTANQAVAEIAYKTNEICPIYPITPASEMSELVEQWSVEKKPNIFGSVPHTIEMQSEAGVAGAMHGALQTGSISTTFTASQGLLLMLPNLYKIAGELTPNVIHVATRSIATHALSVFGDHSDIMAVRQSGYAMLGSASVQEAQDFALIAQASTLQSKIPFIHFFDGFRTSHEISKIETISDATIQFMMDSNAIERHRQRALNPNNPVIRGTAQGPDVFFQSREAINTFYDACPNMVQQSMNSFYTLTGRQYKLFDYVGHPEAEHIIIAMASSTETIESTLNQLNNQGEKFGLIKVRLFRPFSTKHLLEALPRSCKSIGVLDRTKEPGSSGEPLYLDIIQSVSEAFQNNQITNVPKIVGGRYGLSSKEFTPSMVRAIYENLKQERPKNNFTVGINDDVKNLSLDYSQHIQIQSSMQNIIFYQDKNELNSKSFPELTQLIGKQSNAFIQGYTECNYKKSNAVLISHLRIDTNIIKASYGIENADLIACEHSKYIEQNNILIKLKDKGTLLVNSDLSTSDFWSKLAFEAQQIIINKDINLYIVNIDKLKKSYTVKRCDISALQAVFLVLKNEIIRTYSLNSIFQHIESVNTLEHVSKSETSLNSKDFNNSLLGIILANKGNDIPVSLLPPDGTYQSNTSQFNPIQEGHFIPNWNEDNCIQCGACSMACPQAALRIKAYDDSYLRNAPNTFKSAQLMDKTWDINLLNYTIQINPEQCNSCNNCVDACPVNALTLINKKNVLYPEKHNWNHFDGIPELDRSKIDTTKVNQQQLQEPLFKYPFGVEGCGEAPYLKLLSQLYGERLMVANATGASSILGGALPTSPWSKSKNGQGPAWSNSLFEDNAEFGLGYRLSLDQQEQQAKLLLERLVSHLDFNLVFDILKATQNTESEINIQRSRVEELKIQLQAIKSAESKQLFQIVDSLVKKSVWIVGGDGWAYDIGYGGLDHVIASGRNVNILVLDNEVYDNTGGQSSKATPFGATAKFAYGAKQKQKKDLGLLAMTYENVYVASVSIGANQEQTLKAFNEAESYNGPSIIIAYTHSHSHGIEMKTPSKYHKAAVDSGQWLLYRHDPRRLENNKNPLQLDSDPPTIKIEEYLYKEHRFNALFNDMSKNGRLIFRILQKNIDKRFNKYLSKSLVRTPHRTRLPKGKHISNQLNYDQ